MKNFTVRWEHTAALEHLDARAFLGTLGAVRLDEEIGEIERQGGTSARLDDAIDVGAPHRRARG